MTLQVTPQPPATHEGLTQAVQARLQTLLTQLESGTTLPAWGDDDTCRYCDMDGLCRRQAWTEETR